MPKLVLSVIVILFLSLHGIGYAKDFPTKPLRLVVPYPPGGGTDIMSRLVGRKLSERLGHPVVVDNRPGGNGVIGPEIVAGAVPDGHTLLMIISTHTVLPSLQKLSYDLIKDFSPVIHLADLPNVLVARQNFSITSVKDLIATAKKDNRQFTYANGGLGGPSHLSGVLFSHMTGVNLLAVPYKGTGPGMLAVVGEQVDLMFSTLPSAIPHIRAGRVKGLAITGKKRLSVLSDLPTIDESGVKGYELVSWYGFTVRAGTPASSVNYLYREFSALLKDPEMRQLLDAQGAQVTGYGPAEFSSYLQREIKRWAEIVKSTNLKAD